MEKVEPVEVFPFNGVGECWDLGKETPVKPGSTWVMTRLTRLSYGLSLPEDLRNMKEDEVVIVESGFLAELNRSVNYGQAAAAFPKGRPRPREGPHDVYSHHHLLSCYCKYLLRCVVAVESWGFKRHTIERTVEVKYEGRAMIDGYTRQLLRDEETLKSWTRDFRRIYGGR
jgi:hypothetical protein